MANNREISQFAGLVTVNDTSSDVSIGASVTVGTGITFNAGAGTAQFAGDITGNGGFTGKRTDDSYHVFRGWNTSDTQTSFIAGAGNATFAGDITGNGGFTGKRTDDSYHVFRGQNSAGTQSSLITGGGVATFSSKVISGATPDWASATSTGIELNPAAATNYIGIKNSSTSTVTNTAFQINHGLNVNTSILNSGAATFKGKIEAGTSATDHGVEAQSGSSTASYASVSARNYTSGGNVWQGKNAASGTQTSKITETGAATFDKSVDSPAYFGDNNNSGGATSNVTFSIDNNGASMALYSIYCSFYGGSTATTPYNSHITFMIRNGGAGANGHISVDYGTITATESYDSGNDEFDITLTTPSGTRAYGLARVIRIV